MDLVSLGALALSVVVAVERLVSYTLTPKAKTAMSPPIARAEDLLSNSLVQSIVLAFLAALERRVEAFTTDAAVKDVEKLAFSTLRAKIQALGVAPPPAA